jgi:2,3-bisphosphoglycerate-dependent phosphoglycerate mutase
VAGAQRTQAGAGEGTELVLVRHGQGLCNAAGVIGGPGACRGLSELGRHQSERLAERLAEMHGRRPFDVVATSPRPRVLESARIIAARLGLALVVVDGLRGQEFGAADGRPWDDVVRGFGGPPVHDPDRPVAEGAEPWNVYAARVLAALAALLEAHPGERLLLVAHGKTSGLASAMLSGAADPRAEAPAFVLEHGELSHWRCGPGGWERVHGGSSGPVVAPPREHGPGPVRPRPAPRE